MVRLSSKPIFGFLSVLIAASAFVGAPASAQSVCSELFGVKSTKVFKNESVDETVIKSTDRPILISAMSSRTGKKARKFVLPIVLKNGQEAALTFRVPRKARVVRVRRWGTRRKVTRSRGSFEPRLDIGYINSNGNFEDLGALDLESRTKRDDVVIYRYSGEVATSQGPGILVGKMKITHSSSRGWHADSLRLNFRPLESADRPSEKPENPIQTADDFALSPIIESLISSPDILEGDYVEPRLQGVTGPMKFSRTIVDSKGRRAQIAMALGKTQNIKIQAGMSIDPSLFSLKITGEVRGKEISSLDLPFDRIWPTTNGRTVRYAAPMKTANRSGLLVGLVHQEISYKSGRARWENQNLEMRFIPDDEVELVNDADADANSN